MMSARWISDITDEMDVRWPSAESDRFIYGQDEGAKPVRALCCLLLAAAGLMCLPAISQAQGVAGSTGADQSAVAKPSGGGLEEIVVTAQRHEERLTDVPMSITAFSQEQLDTQGLKNIDDLSRLSPGLTFIRNGFVDAFNDEQSDISIRGVDSNAGAATTGIYIDDAPIQTRHLNFGSVSPYPALFDLDRVEVLRGPQGTLFGAGSEGGTVRFITPSPSLTTYQGYARTEVAQIQNGGLNYEAGAAFGGPIIDHVLGFRISASFREDGGWVDRVNYTTVPTATNPLPVSTGITEKNANWKDTTTLRAALKWMPNESLTIEPSVFVQTLHLNDTSVYWLSLSNPSRNVYNNGNAQRDSSTDPWYLPSLKVTWALPFGQLVSNTSYLHRKQHGVSDYSEFVNAAFFGNPFPQAADNATAFFQDNQNNFTEELRLSSLDLQARVQWSAGLFYSHAFENTTETILDPSFGALEGFTPPYRPDGLIYSQPVFSMLDKQIAAFGEVTFKFTNTFKATAGLRVAKVDYTGVAQESGLFLFGANVSGSNSGSETPVTPRFVLNYQPDKDSLYYLSAAKGYRPGGANPALPPVCTASLPTQVPSTFKSDSLWQYEIGSKNTLLDRRLQVNASVYYFRWNSIQQFEYLLCGLGFTPNQGDVVGRGGDVEVQWRASDGLTMGLTAAYTDSYYTSTVSLTGIGQPVNLVTKGDHLAASPWNINTSAEYIFKGSTRLPYLRLDYQYTTAQNSLIPYQDAANLPNADPTLPGLPNIRVLGIRAGMRFSGFDVSAFMQNALNYHTPTYENRDYPASFDTNYYGRGLAPRTIGLTATYRY